MTENDNAVEAMVYKGQHAAKQRCEGFHRSSPVDLCLSNKIIGQTAGGDQRCRRDREREERVQGNETAGFVPLEFGHFLLVMNGLGSSLGTSRAGTLLPCYSTAFSPSSRSGDRYSSKSGASSVLYAKP